MLYNLAQYLVPIFGPARLLQSNAVLICLSLYAGFFLTSLLLPKFYKHLPCDRGREFTIHAEAAKGKPTGAGVVFITFFVLITLVFAPMNALQVSIVVLTWVTMLTGFFDDRSLKGWGEYRKAALDLLICLAATAAMLFLRKGGINQEILFWLPFASKQIAVHPLVFTVVSTVLLWASINTTNCTDGVDGLSSMLVLIGLGTMGVIFYFILGHKDIAEYLLIPAMASGASWGIITFSLCGVLMGYLWHNAFPSKVLMGDAGSRALGFFIGCAVMVSGNPFLILATSSIIMVNGGMGLLKVALLRFFKIKIFTNIRFPLHDHMRKNHNWSPTQVMLKFMIMQILITIAVVGIIFKVR
ncbi:MAG: phospho-N-acetylmuramoyl-pentapeptide-transferase [Spirochaetaceae bacterium]|nr:phospho-N-acetylmuramoyl-pentapeptide-transferase [Spirochaetaceae bacterium]MBR4823561.1 phospho-N-acetylmuramoyl-pentapeptide-transferase [Spirochaetaceae bacterium]